MALSFSPSLPPFTLRKVTVAAPSTIKLKRTAVKCSSSRITPGTVLKVKVLEVYKDEVVDVQLKQEELSYLEMLEKEINAEEEEKKQESVSIPLKDQVVAGVPVHAIGFARFLLEKEVPKVVESSEVLKTLAVVSAAQLYPRMCLLAYFVGVVLRYLSKVEKEKKEEEAAKSIRNSKRGSG